jgi:hypothetical protein
MRPSLAFAAPGLVALVLASAAASTPWLQREPLEVDP